MQDDKVREWYVAARAESEIIEANEVDVDLRRRVIQLRAKFAFGSNLLISLSSISAMPKTAAAAGSTGKANPGSS